MKVGFFLFVGFQHRFLKILAAFHCNGMCNVTMFILSGSLIHFPNIDFRVCGELSTALIAVAAMDYISVATPRTSFLRAPRRHCHKKSFAAFNYLDVTDHKTVVEGDGRKCAQFLVRIFRLLKNSNLSNFHARLPSEKRGLNKAVRL